MTDATGREFEADRLPGLTVGYQDALIVGALTGRLTGNGEEMLFHDFRRVSSDVLIGAGVGVADLSTVGLVVIHPHYMPMARSRLALAVAGRLRRRRLETGLNPNVVTIGARPSSGEVPDGLALVAHPVQVHEADGWYERAVWEVMLAEQYDEWSHHCSRPELGWLR
ncbi:hypothetical protein [Frankia sp. Cr2]|uniref:hypothetical protein n=1 Tax=Frankia sp. Cr2 TaxID=3073932 RepID=UPI002AD1D538|nr:hypothetical protein [Frankia sp. Cr2]